VNDGHLLVAYHGCDITIRDSLVTGRTAIRDSRNEYDWLGSGSYFYEGDPDRALSFADVVSRTPARRLTASPIATPAVVGAVLCVQRTLDMTTRPGLAEFEDAAFLLKAAWVAEGTPEEKRPVNVPPEDGEGDVLNRKLDNAVIESIHAQRGKDGEPAYQMVRGAFRQGVELVPNSGFHKDSHVQLAVRDRSCILGWFLLPGESLLGAKAFGAAKKQLDEAIATYPRTKPRQRVSVDGRYHAANSLPTRNGRE
jgi:hypothetical protein